MSIRSIEIPVLSKTEPTLINRYWGGMQYEDCATEIVFNLPEEEDQSILYRIDFNSSATGYHPSENLSAESGKIRRSIPKYITVYGGEVQVTAVATKDGAVCYSYPAIVYFTAVEKNEKGDSSVEGNISEMEAAVTLMTESALNAAAKAEDSARSAEEYKNATERARFSLQNEAEFIFLGGGAEEPISAELVIDSAMSDESENPVKNCVIKEYIDTQISALRSLLPNNP